MKIMNKLLSAILAAVLILTACGTASAEETVRMIESAADADAWAAAFFSEQPEEMDGAWAMTAQMESAVARMGGIGAMAKQFSALGAVEKVSPAYEGELQGYKAFYIPCVFPAASVDLILVVDGGAIAGVSTGKYTGDREEAAAQDSFDSMELSLPAPGLGELPGILTVPKGDGPFPAVILLQGSGASDRDEAVGSLKPFRDIAEGLSLQGVAVYRFDKRTYVYGMALAAKKDISLEDEYIEDAVNAVRLVAAQEKIDPDRIFVLGHSLGGNAVPAIARALEDADVKACGFVMMAASPRPLDVLMREQYDYLYSLLPEVTPEQQAEKDALFADLDKLKDLASLKEDDTVAGVYSAYWKWLAAYDIVAAAREIEKPLLILQGEEDYQVTLEDFSLWQTALGEKENVRFISYPGLTHTFVPGQKSEGGAVYTRDGHVEETVIRDIAAFVLEAQP